MSRPALPPLDDAARRELAAAVQLLEHPGLAVRLAHLAGAPVEKGLARLPARAHALISTATEKAVGLALKLALTTMASGRGRGRGPGPGPVAPADQDADTRTHTGTGTRLPAAALPAASPRWHQAAVMATGAGAGFFGLPALLLELPLTTTLMMRAIADVARSEGADLGEEAVRLDCVGVLMLGGPGRGDDGSTLGYFAAREAFAQVVAQALGQFARHAAGAVAPPAVLRVIALVAERLGVQVTEKFALQALPVLGAAGGATLNLLFVQHFQAMARGHFVVRRLEQRHGVAAVRAAWREAGGH